MNVLNSTLVILTILLMKGLLYSESCRSTSDSTSEVVVEPKVYEGSNCSRECTSPAENAVCKYEFNVEWYYSMSKACYDCPFNMTDCNRQDCIPLNGVARPVMVANRQLPGPMIEACEGDTIEVTVNNLLDNAEGLSIHWHGLHARDAQYMDGVAMLTQCPISSQGSFVYSFKANPAGTHWWHSHAGMQRADGLFGALIVRKPKSEEVYKYDHDEHVLLVNDWLHKMVVNKFTEYHHSIGSNKADSILINGKGVNRTFASNTHTPREVFTVERGMTYRFRAISGAITNCGLKISVDSHSLSMIASDGAPINDQTADSFIMYAGERFDFILNANQDIGNYWVRVYGVESGCNKTEKVFELAILRYKGAPEVDPSNSTERIPQVGTTVNALDDNIDPEGVDDDDISIRRLTSHEKDDVTFSQEADKTFFIGMDFNNIDNVHFNRPSYYPIHKVIDKDQRTYTPQLNHISFGFPSSPPLSQYDDIPEETFCPLDTFNEETDYSHCYTEYCQCTQVIDVSLNSVIELVVVNEDKMNFDTSHPMHLHGHYFRVIGYEKIGRSTTLEHVKQMHENGTLRREIHLSLKKDTVIVPNGGYVVLRFYADNPGWWFFHCHLEYHVEIGMALIVHVGDQDDLDGPPKNFPQCGHFSINGISTTESQHLVMILTLILYFIYQ